MLPTRIACSNVVVSHRPAKGKKLNDRMTVATALQAVAASGDDRYGILLQRGTLEIGFYAPQAVDPQTPHDRDEVYVIHSGSGTFVLGDDTQPFEAGDVLFVAAGTTHRFQDFSDDFGTWVVFTGPPA